MALNEEFKSFVLDQLQGIVEFETKRMFGALELYHQGSAFAKIKHDKVWLKVDDTSYSKFERYGMSQYRYKNSLPSCELFKLILGIRLISIKYLVYPGHKGYCSYRGML
jgi:TfoX/Sxy family transcriptional regulator of competence genes